MEVASFTEKPHKKVLTESNSPLKTYYKNILSLSFGILLMFWILLQSGCIVISTAGTIAATAVNTTVSVAGHTVKTAVDVVVPDGEDKD